MKKNKKIAILTSGGDASGMNQFIACLNNKLDKKKYELVAIKNGLEGLYNNKFSKLDDSYINACGQQAGSMIFSSRFLLLKNDAKQALEVIKKNLIDNQIDCLIILGGNGTLAATLNHLNKIIDIIFIPCSIDNDLIFSQYSLGFDSALNAAVNNINQIYNSIKSYHQILIGEVMGNHNPELTIQTALATNADFVFIDNKLSLNEIIDVIKPKVTQEKSLLIIFSELNYSHQQLNELCESLQSLFNKKTKLHIIGFLQRGAYPSAFDLSLANQFALYTIECLESNQLNIALSYQQKEINAIKLNELNLNDYKQINYETLVKQINKGE